MVDATKAFEQQSQRGGVPDIAPGQHVEFHIYDFDVARSRSGLTCVIARVTPAGKTSENEYLMTRLPGADSWSIVRVGGAANQSSVAMAR
jgi:hypothetical protein